jgi:opacity protein-like surface antigen
MKMQQLLAAAFVAALTAGTAPVLSAQETPAAPAAGNNAFVHVGGGIYSANIKFGDFTDGKRTRTLAGGTIGGGFSLLPSNVGHLRLAFDLGIYSNAKTTSEIDADETYRNTYSFKEDYLFVPILANVTYEFNLGSPQFRARAGVVLGATVLNTSLTDTWTFTEEYDNRFESEKNSNTKTVLTYGVNVGFTWTPKENFLAACQFFCNFVWTVKEQMGWLLSGWLLR